MNTDGHDDIAAEVMECRIHLRYQHHLRGVTESDAIERLKNNSQHQRHSFASHSPRAQEDRSLLKELWLSSFPSYSVGPCCVPGIALSPKHTAINKTAAVCLRWPE